MTHQSAHPISERIAAARKARGLRSHQLATLIGAHASQVSRWEHHQVPTLGTLNLIAKHCGVSAAWLTHGVGKGPVAVTNDAPPNPLPHAS